MRQLHLQWRQSLYQVYRGFDLTILRGKLTHSTSELNSPSIVLYYIANF
jgi:hypothetical protein